MFKLVGVLVLLLVQIDEVVSDALFVARLHVPADLEGVAGDAADLDALRDGELARLRDAAVLGFTSCVVDRKLFFLLYPPSQVYIYRHLISVVKQNIDHSGSTNDGY